MKENQISILSELMWPMLNIALGREIEAFRANPKAKLINISTFDPLNSTYCFIGQIGQQPYQISPETRESPYRDAVGRIPEGYGLGKWKHSTRMTPLEIWSAENWVTNRNLVMDVVRYIRGDIDIKPVVVYKELNDHP